MSPEALIQKGEFPWEIFTPIGNKESQRHLVYRFFDGAREEIVKVFRKQGSLENELRGHEFAVRQGMKTYELLAVGKQEGGQDYMIMSCLPGVNGREISLERDGAAVFLQMGENLARLHNNRMEGKPGHKERLAANLERLYAQTEQLTVDGNTKALFLKAYGTCKEQLERAEFGDVRFGYGHGDYDLRNVQVQDGVLTGVYDFEASAYTNTELDMVQLYRKYLMKKAEYEEAFLEGYKRCGSIPEGYPARRPVYLLMEGLRNCGWAYRQDYAYYEENLRFLKDCLERE